VVMAAAVADFRPATRVPGKLSRRAGGAAPAPEALPLVANPDLLAELGRARAVSRPYLVGFAAETGGTAAELEARAKLKLREKGCDVIVANDVSTPGLGFGSDENAVTLVFADGATAPLARAAKSDIANGIWDRVSGRLPGATREREAGAARRRSTVGRPAALRATRVRGGRRG